MDHPPALVVSALGRRIGISLPHHDAPQHAEVLAELRRIWERCIVDAGPTDAVVEVPAAAAPGDEKDARAAFSSLTQQVTRAAILGATGDLIMLHAAAVANGTTGNAMAFVAPGGTGKTTLSRTVGRAYRYVTDETVGIRPDGVILPYPKPLSLRVPAGGKKETSPAELGLLPLGASPRLSGIVLLDRRDSHSGGVEVSNLSLFEAILAMVPESSSVWRLERPLHVLADLIDGTGGAQRWTYRESRDLLPLITERLGAA